MRFDDLFRFGVIDHCHNTVANDDFEDIRREGCGVENAAFLLLGECDLHGDFPLGWCGVI
jgi:hypothetical protein